jgi:hypothetical protein
MDLSKYPLEKLFHFVASILPGSVALLIYQQAVPGAFGWFFALGFLGYRTKLSLILLAAFVIGYSLIVFLSSILGAIGGAYGAIISMRPYQPPHSYRIAPWRDPRWRLALKGRLGPRAPNDTNLMSEELLNMRRDHIARQPEEQRSMALADLELERTATEVDDGNWAQWYRQYHQIVFNLARQDFYWYVKYGLEFNLETSAICILIGAIVVPNVRHWWCILPSCMWALLLVGQQHSELKQFTDPWSTLSGQITHLLGSGDGTKDLR